MPAPVILVAVLAAAVIGFAFVFGTPILGVPIALIILGAFGVLQLQRRKKTAEDIHEFRDQAQAESIEFTARDKETQT